VMLGIDICRCLVFHSRPLDHGGKAGGIPRLFERDPAVLRRPPSEFPRDLGSSECRRALQLSHPGGALVRMGTWDLSGPTKKKFLVSPHFICQFQIKIFFLPFCTKKEQILSYFITFTYTFC
jgi:hypothetical protein